MPRVQHKEDFTINGLLNGLDNIGAAETAPSKINPLLIGLSAAALAFMFLKKDSLEGVNNSKLYGTYVLAGVTTMAVAKMMQ